MKRLLTIPVLVACISLASRAQKLDDSKVPAAVKASFAKQYPLVTAKWEKESNKYEANFKQVGVAWSLLMDDKGKILETEMNIKASDLPGAALTYFKEHYKAKTIKECARISKADGTVNYEVEAGSKDVIFDEKGKFLKEINN